MGERDGVSIEATGGERPTYRPTGGTAKFQLACSPGRSVCCGKRNIINHSSPDSQITETNERTDECERKKERKKERRKTNEQKIS